ncbi:hypothetical protein M899_3348 [Bacteriovorax sp. BSW11_IV]|uniref:hypothetical protein n=1 Tax=Bacteriovorax sp. BSW11_IV TaxID=1353529 RepID=UPI00038A31D9|nr:hypothetical protein [Bacteriovorax sp. BSW11_IV]EQC48780.1 hypothetical protein M899_3348 [Bacteriovorax sp. BSW11_IV]
MKTLLLMSLMLSFYTKAYEPKAALCREMAINLSNELVDKEPWITNIYSRLVELEAFNDENAYTTNERWKVTYYLGAQGLLIHELSLKDEDCLIDLIKVTRE